MLDAHLVVAADDGTLQEAPDVLDPVGVNVAAHPFLDRVVYGLMSGVVVSDATVGAPVVSVDRFRLVGDVLLDPGVECPLVASMNNLEPDLALTFHRTNDGGFVGAASLADFLLLPTDPSFVNLNDTGELASVSVPHGFTDTVAEVPGRLVAHAERTLDLIGRHALLGFDHEVDGGKPLPERQLRVVEDRPRCNREAVAAVITIKLVPGSDLRDGAGSASRAAGAGRPAELFEVFAANILRMEPFNELDEIQIGGVNHGR